MTSDSTTSSVLLPPGGQRILVIMAHPDDAEFICGGTIARLAAESCDISYVLVTSGNRGSHEPGMTMERLAKIREEEQRRAADALGVRDVTFLGHNDGEVEVTMALRSELVLCHPALPSPTCCSPSIPGGPTRFTPIIATWAPARSMPWPPPVCPCTTPNS